MNDFKITSTSTAYQRQSTIEEPPKLPDHSDNFSFLPQIDKRGLLGTSPQNFNLLRQDVNDPQKRFQAQISQINDEQQLLELFLQQASKGILKNIHTLKFPKTSMSQELLIFVAENCLNLQKLSLPIENLETLDVLTQLPQLTSLSIFEESDFGDIVSEASSKQLIIDSIAKLKNLEYLEVKLDFSLASGHCLDFESWNCLKKIKSLIMSTCFPFKFPDQLLREELLHLEIHSDFLQNKHLTHISKALNLESLNLSGCKSITSIEPDWPFTKLKLINLRDTPIKLPAFCYRNLRTLICEEDNLLISDESEYLIEVPELKLLHFTSEQSAVKIVATDDELIFTSNFNFDPKIICPTEDGGLPEFFYDLINFCKKANVGLFEP